MKTLSDELGKNLKPEIENVDALTDNQGAGRKIFKPQNRKNCHDPHTRTNPIAAPLTTK